MFRDHRIGSNTISAKNLVLLFFTIVFGFASVITLAEINIPTDINNAWQTIGRITITNDGTDAGTVEMNISSTGIYFNPGILESQSNISGKILGINDEGYLMYFSGNSTIRPGSSNDWSVVGNDMHSVPSGNVGIGTQTMSGKLHITSSGDTDIYIEEQAPGMAASLRLLTPEHTWIVGGDSDPDVFFIGVLGHQEYLTINPLGNVGIGAINPTEKLTLDGNILLLHGTGDREIKMAQASTNSEIKKLSIRGTNAPSGPIINTQECTLFRGDVYINGGKGSIDTNGNPCSPHGNIILANDGGKVGIGSGLDDPQTALDVNGLIRTRNIESGICTGSDNVYGAIGYNSGDDRFYGCTKRGRIPLDNDGSGVGVLLLP